MTDSVFAAIADVIAGAEVVPVETLEPGDSLFDWLGVTHELRTVKVYRAHVVTTRRDGVVDRWEKGEEITCKRLRP